MLATIISPPAVSAVDATLGVATGGDTPIGIAATNVANVDSQASIVELSAQAITLSATAATAVSTAPAVVETAPSVAVSIVAAQAVNPAVPNTDPAVAAAIAAYRLGDGLFTERDSRAEQISQEEELDIVPVPAIQGSKIDLHDSARDDALHGSVWNWIRVHPVQRKFTQR